MQELLEKMHLSAVKEINEADEINSLSVAKIKYLGKKGEITSLLKKMGELSPEERPVVGKIVNEVRKSIEGLFEEKEQKLRNELLLKKLKRLVLNLRKR